MTPVASCKTETTNSIDSLKLFWLLVEQVLGLKFSKHISLIVLVENFIHEMLNAAMIGVHTQLFILLLFVPVFCYWNLLRKTELNVFWHLL